MEVCKRKQPCPDCGEPLDEVGNAFWCRNSKCKASWFDKDKPEVMERLKKAKPRGADQFSVPGYIKLVG